METEQNSELKKASFTDFFIKRPVFAVSICLIMLLVGIISYVRLPVRHFPKIDSSVVTVTTTYPGASSRIMDAFVTTPIENAIAGVQGIDYVQSSSTYSTSTITINLRLGYNINDAISDINTQVSSVRWELPVEINDPIIQKNDPNATPLYYLSFTSKNMSTVQMGNFLTTVLKPMLLSVSGVGSVNIFGSTKYAMRIWLDPNLMSAQSITANDIYNALTNNNIQSTAGKIKTAEQEFPIYTNTDLHSAAQFNDLILRQSDNQITRLRDVGHAELGPQNDNFSSFLDGESSVTMMILPKSTANPLVVAKNLRVVLPDAEKMLPKGMKLALSYDVSQFIAASIKEVYVTIIEAVIIVTLVIFLFLGSWRTVIVPLVTIPLSLISVCSLLLMLGYSVNTLTLLAAVLAIGLVVDDAIVVTENIHRHILMGEPPLKAAIMGAREIRFTVIAMTLTLASAYLPIAFVTGLTGILFSEFALTLACTVIISGIIALALSPMMCHRLISAEKVSGGFAAKVDDISQRVSTRYKNILRRCLQWRWRVLIVGLIIYIIGIFAFDSLPTQLAPPEDQGYLFAIMNGPAAANLHYTEQHSEAIGKMFKNNPAVSHTLLVNGFQGINTAVAVAILKPWGTRMRAMPLLFSWVPQLQTIPGVRAFPFNPPTLPGSSGFVQVQYVLKTTGSYDYLDKVTQDFMTKAKQWPGQFYLDTDLKMDKPELDLNINRDLTSNLGISMKQIAQSLSIFLGQPTTTRFSLDGQNYEVIPQLMAQYRNNPNDLNNLYVRTSNNEMIPLRNLVAVKKDSSLRSRNHFQQLRSATISLNLSPGYTLGDALKHLNKLAKSHLPNNVHVDYAGQLRQLVEASGKMLQVFIFAVVFIYLILAMQFENFLDPLIVMLSVPLSLTGALLALKAFSMLTGSLNIYTEIGLVTLLGLMSKQTILIVEFANQLQQRGYEFTEAILTAAAQRLRPIVMTSVSMVLGALPLALAILSPGAGSNSRFQMGLTIVSGLAIGTLLTVFIIPVVYSLLSPRKQKIEH
ncbi:MAG: efflux RND transporter permease subunit [Gammaproteobacteria bacterium]|nr:efflux RND transporter permease subunit [Gammaproteobacteria bacterium]